MPTIPRQLAEQTCQHLVAAPDPNLEAAVRQVIEAASLTYAGFAPGAEALARQLLSCLEDHETAAWSERIRGLKAPEVWLCAASSEGVEEAVREFERRLGPEISTALNRFGLAEDQKAELGQRVRVRLLVAGEKTPPRISLYRGWGSLEGWVRTLTARLALNFMRDAKVARPADHAPELVGASPEFASLKSTQRGLFMQALGTAFHSLEDRERALLRLRYLDGVQANALAVSYNVHESTMSRWLTKARDTLQTRFAAEARRLVPDDAAATDLLDAMQSGFGQSLHELFLSKMADTDASP